MFGKSHTFRVCFFGLWILEKKNWLSWLLVKDCFWKALSRLGFGWTKYIIYIINTMPLGTAIPEGSKSLSRSVSGLQLKHSFWQPMPAAFWFQLRLLASRSQLQAEINRPLFMMINLFWSSLGLFHIWITTLILCTSIILTDMSVRHKHRYCILLLLYVRYKPRGFFF